MSLEKHKQRRDNPCVIHVVVVEYHQHALEHIHSKLRRRKSLKPWSMLHFDAHPDLACPSNHVPALSCFLPRQDEHDLYELLDSHSSGIAEWILPMVLAAELRHVHWIKPMESRQLPLGNHHYHVGAWTPSSGAPNHQVESFLDLPWSARVRVDWKHPYYLDDASVVPTDELCLAKKLELTVSELSEEFLESSFDQAIFEGDWALDICLDCFCCRNPFLTDIEAIDERFTQALVHVVTKTRLHNATNSSDYSVLEPANYKRELSHFRAAFEQLLQEQDASSINKLLQFYESPHEAREFIENLLTSLLQTPDSAKLSTMAMEALPNLCMPHDPKSSMEGTQESIRLRLEAMSMTIQHVKNSSGNPFMITIARSTLDGFTPASVAENLQDQVISCIHDIFCECNIIDRHGDGPIRPELFESQDKQQCRLKVIFDFGEWEGATLES